MKRGIFLMVFLVVHQAAVGSNLNEPSLHCSLRSDAHQKSGLLAARAARVLLDVADRGDNDNFDLISKEIELGRKVSGIQQKAEEMKREFGKIRNGRPAPLSRSCFESFSSLCSEAQSLKSYYSEMIDGDGPLVGGEPMIESVCPPGKSPQSYFDLAIRALLMDLVTASDGVLPLDEIPSPLSIGSSRRTTFSRMPTSLTSNAVAVAAALPASVDLTDLNPFVPVMSVDCSDDEEALPVPPNIGRQRTAQE